MRLNAVAAALTAIGIAAAVQATAAEHVVAVRAGKLVDVVAGKVLENQTILVKGERIAAVGPSASVSVPAGAEIVDLSHSTVLPGLINVQRSPQGPRLPAHLA